MERLSTAPHDSPPLIDGHFSGNYRLRPSVNVGRVSIYRLQPVNAGYVGECHRIYLWSEQTRYPRA